MLELDARNISYRALNEMIRARIREGARHLNLVNVAGQRYIGDGLCYPDVHLAIHGVPGEDLCAFMDGPTVVVHSNAQNGVGNTMNGGRVIVHGMAGDVVGYGMRGGRIYIKGDVGYRVGIHMKGYLDRQPIIVVGGRAGSFFGEYMAGGYLICLGLTSSNCHPAAPVVGDYCATGMHGGTIYIRGEVGDHQLGREVKRFPLNDADIEFLTPILEDFLQTFSLPFPNPHAEVFDFKRYAKIIPVSTRPYGRLYAY